MKRKVMPLFIAASMVLLVAAGSASAATWQTQRSEWFNGATGTTLAIGTTKSLNLFSGANILLRGKLGGANAKIEWKKVRCLSCVIENIAVGAPTEVEAKATVQFGLEEATVVEPAGCSTSTLTSNMLTETIGMKSGGTGAPAKFAPKEGETIGTLKITGCAIEGSYKLSGTFYAESANATGVSATVQSQTLSEAVQKELGGESLKLGTEPAFFTGTFKNELASGEQFQVKE